MPLFSTANQLDPAAIASKLPSSLQWAGGAILQGLKSALGGDDPTSIMNVGAPMMAADTEISPMAYKAVQGLKGMYSRLTDAIASRMPEMAHVNKVNSIIKNFATPEEADYRGLTDFLAGKQRWWRGNVSKQEVLQHLEQNPINLETRTIGGPPPPYNPLTVNEDLEAMEDTKYSNYKVPGGQNYQENLIKLPVPSDPQTGANLNPIYNSPHWEDPNVLVHSRTAEHNLPLTEDDVRSYITDPESDPLNPPSSSSKGRLIENVQSDWHQAGSQHGYSATELPEGYTIHHGQPSGGKENSWSQTTNIPHFEVHDPSGNWVQAGLTQEDAIMNALDTINRERVPDAPFKTSWPDLALKQQIYSAAQDPNINWLGITPNSELAKRGEAMAPQFQDQTLPSKLGKLLKPFGGSVEQGNLESPRANVNWEPGSGRYGVADDPTLLTSDNFNTVASHSGIESDMFGNPYKLRQDQTPDPGQFINYVNFNRPAQQISFSKVTLTPEMKQQILKKGFPLLGLMGAGAYDQQDQQP